MSDILDNYKASEDLYQVPTAKGSVVEKCLKLVESLFFPTICGGCGQPGQLLCEECEGKLKFDTLNRCLVCEQLSVYGHTHLSCASDVTPEKFISIFTYQPPFSRMLQKIKYRQKSFSYLEPLLKIACEDLTEKGLEFGDEALVVPIPLHWFKRWQRGFNVADLIGQKIAKEFKLTYKPEVLTRTRNTKTQTKLTRPERRKNVAAAFTVPSRFINDIKDRDILLIDDVCTTGATLLSAAAALKSAGSGQVWCSALARD